MNAPELALVMTLAAAAAFVAIHILDRKP